MVIEITSLSDCEELIKRINDTLAKTNPAALNRIKQAPPLFPNNDIQIFKGLCKAILSIQTSWDKVEPHLELIESILCNYNFTILYETPDDYIDTQFSSRVKGNKVSINLLHKKLNCCKANAESFVMLSYANKSSVGQVITNILNQNGNVIDPKTNCYINPNDDALINHFTRGLWKLSGVRLAICCEFFNNVGIDEFKPDSHIKDFFRRIGIVSADVKDPVVRALGITIARTLSKSRKYVDSTIWNFCAEHKDSEAICTGKNPKCHLCDLKNVHPPLCLGI